MTASSPAVPLSEREALRELHDAILSQMPPFEAGREAQERWADRRSRAINNASIVLAGQASAEGARSAEAGGEVASGFVTVPCEPTPAMRKAAADAWLDCDSKLLLNKAGAAVRAAVAAAKDSK